MHSPAFTSFLYSTPGLGSIPRTPEESPGERAVQNLEPADLAGLSPSVLLTLATLPVVRRWWSSVPEVHAQPTSGVSSWLIPVGALPTPPHFGFPFSPSSDCTAIYIQAGVTQASTLADQPVYRGGQYCNEHAPAGVGGKEKRPHSREPPERPGLRMLGERPMLPKPFTGFGMEKQALS